jgi:hypothetical protein
MDDSLRCYAFGNLAITTAADDDKDGEADATSGNVAPIRSSHDKNTIPSL